MFLPLRISKREGSLFYPRPLLFARALPFLLAMGGSWLATNSHGADTANPTLVIRVEHPILLLASSPPDKPASTNLSVLALNFPANALLAYNWTQIQDAVSPLAAQMGDKKTIAFASPNAPATVASFNGWGVYEINLTVTDRRTNVSASRHTWVNVWDNHSHIVVDGKEDPLGIAPGLLPPPSVRQLSPDPGPFCHPRLYCTARDWAEISQRCREGKLASKGAAKLREEVAASIDNPASPSGKLTRALETYADANYKGAAPDLTMGAASDPAAKDPFDKAKENLGGYYTRLRDASFLAWLSLDPALPQLQVPTPIKARFRQLAKVTAAVAHVQFTGSYDEAAGKFNPRYPLYPIGLDHFGEGMGSDFSNLAFAYDFTASWMTPAEQQQARTLLFAASTGRTTGARSPGFASGTHGRLYRGYENNGDFMNIEELKVLANLAVEGEEAGISPKVVQTFTSPAKPEKYETAPHFTPFDWMQFCGVDGKGGSVGSRPYPAAASWPNARKVSVDNLQRAIWWNDDWYVTPWGFTLNKIAYYGGFSAWGLWPTAVAYGIRGAENQYVTGLFYTTVQHLLYYSYPGEGENVSPLFRTKVFLYDHHDSDGWDYRQTHMIMLKYMYPDDPAVDYVYAANAPNLGFNPFTLALFGLDPGINGKPTTLPQVAAEKNLPLTKLDPQLGIVVARSGWQENDMKLDFDAGWPHTGHMHAEKNSFSLFALGRQWSVPPGYHVVPSNFQAGVLIQDPASASDPDTQGYVGESPALVPKGSSFPECYPSPPAKLLEVSEGPRQAYALMAGDASAAYDFGFRGDNKGSRDTGLPRSAFMYPGVFNDLISRCKQNQEWFSKTLFVCDFNPVQYALRSILLVRGAHPYCLIVDDIKKEDKPRNYRWTMNSAHMFGPPNERAVGGDGKGVKSSLDLAPGATATDAILFHSPIDDEKTPGEKGLPRMLLRDVSEQINRNQPPIVMNRQLGATRVFVDRNNVVEPKYKILFFPYRTGEALPETSWNANQTALKVDFKDGTIDTVTFDGKQPDHRTRMRFERAAKG